MVKLGMMRRCLVGIFAGIALFGAAPALAREDVPGLRGHKAVVLFFVATDCPVSNSYAPEIRQICAQYAPRGIAFRLVYPDANLSPAAAKRHATEYDFGCPAVLGPKGRLARVSGATVTPEAAVYRADGVLVYRGRIDDKFVGFGRQRVQAARHDLRQVLDALTRGEAQTPHCTRAVGCFIPGTAAAQ